MHIKALGYDRSVALSDSQRRRRHPLLWKEMVHVKHFFFSGVGVALPRIPRPHEGDPSWLSRRACGPDIPRSKESITLGFVHPALTVRIAYTLAHVT